MAAASALSATASRSVRAALEAVVRAAHVTMTLQAGIVRTDASASKDDASPVTVADFAAEVVVAAFLRASLGEDSFCMVSEEDAGMLSKDENAPMLEAVVAAANAGLEGVTVLDGAGVTSTLSAAHRSSADGRGAWVLDPIDGTKGFLRGTQHQYAIGLGLLGADGAPSVGVLACPNLPVAPVLGDPASMEGPRGVVLVGVVGVGCVQFPLPECLAASAGEAAGLIAAEGGALSDLLPGGTTARPHHSPDPSSWRMCESFEAAHSSHSVSAAIAGRVGITNAPVQVDSMVKYALLARGDAQLYLRLPGRGYAEKIWDHAAGVAVLTSAGGSATDTTGGKLPFGESAYLDGISGIIASSFPAAEHAELVRTIDADAE